MEKCKTLGEETYFEFSYLNDELKIKYGFTVENVVNKALSMLK